MITFLPGYAKDAREDDLVCVASTGGAPTDIAAGLRAYEHYHAQFMGEIGAPLRMRALQRFFEDLGVKITKPRSRDSTKLSSFSLYEHSQGRHGIQWD
ncbi:unnamed protein product, partial [Amoebophrya sp. A25]|eukprot:GSA25T00012125001.1